MSSELVEDPVLRQRYRFARDGDILRVDVWAEPGSAVPDHFHPRLAERWEVVEGQVTFRIDGDDRPAGPGDRLVAPAGVRHSFENTGSEPMHLLAIYSPGGPEAILRADPGCVTLPAGEWPVLD